MEYYKLKNMITRRLIDAAKVILGKAKVIHLNIKTPYCCNVCGKNNVTFEPLPIHYLYHADKYQFIHNIFHFETINIAKFLCNNCAASDRDRLYALYIDKIKDKYTHEINLLDIAPYPPLSAFLNKIKLFKIRTADLYAEGVDDKVDITKMDIYSDESFDVFICSHVLEHVVDELSGMKELYRILKKGGWGIAMVPINTQFSQNYIYPEAKTEEDRWRHYGHSDHQRLNSKKGFVDSLKSVGFKVLELDKDYFGIENFEKYGIHERSVLYIVQK